MTTNNERIKNIQKALNVEADGIIGDQTLSALESTLNIDGKTNMTEPTPLPNGKIVCLCVGHSSKDEGAINNTLKIAEYTYNKELAELIQADLANYNIQSKIVNRLTDGGGTGMSADVKAVNSFKSDCIVELHCNAFNEKASGTETLYWITSTKGKKLASSIQAEMVKVLELPDRGIKGIGGSERGGTVLKESLYPMVITEPLFIDNYNDITKGIKLKNELATAISQGIVNYLS